MCSNSILNNRKNDHIKINLNKNVKSSLKNGLENFRFVHEALPEIDLHEINTSQTIFSREVKLPILISSMTGGTPEAQMINQNLARAAQSFGIAMGVGSQRAAIEDPQTIPTFQVRNLAPDILLFANLGAVQLNYGYGIDECKKAVEMIEADALILHLNPLQEAIQPEGDTNFKGLLRKIEQICSTLSVPVIVKEVGWGVSAKTAEKLINIGVRAIDIAGAGGTSWSNVEKFRAQKDIDRQIAKSFHNWGLTTSESIKQVSSLNSDIHMIASGGIQNGIDICKCVALGSSLVGNAATFLEAAVISQEAVETLILRMEKEIQVCMFAVGAKNIQQLKKCEMIEKA